MKSVSKCQMQPQSKISRTQLQSALLRRTYAQHSLEHCFPPSKIIHQLLHNKKSKLSIRLREIEMEDEEEIMEGYFNKGLTEISELTEYYKYYTQTSILHQQSFFQIMHHHREQQKAYHYHKFKALLNLSNSTQNLSTFEVEREAGVGASSFLLLKQLSMISNNEESLLIVKLKDKLQSDFGPNRYHTLQEIDKQYIFTKKIHVIPSQAKKNDKINPKQAKETTERNNSVKKRLQKKRNNTCDLELFSSCKTEVQSKLKRKKNASMTSLCSVDKNIPMTRESSLKATRTLFKPMENIQNQVKSKIIGVKEKIRQQKEQLLKKSEMARPKKQGEKANRRQRH